MKSTGVTPFRTASARTSMPRAMDLVEHNVAPGLSAQKRLRVLHLARVGWPLEIQIDRLVPAFIRQRARECGLPNLP